MLPQQSSRYRIPVWLPAALLSSLVTLLLCVALWLTTGNYSPIPWEQQVQSARAWMEVPEVKVLLNGTASAEIVVPQAVADNLLPRELEQVTERVLRTRLHALTKEVGRLHCKIYQVGPTGGYCMNVTAGSEVGGNGIMDAGVCAGLADLFTGTSVADFGCGMGQYGACLRKQHRGIRWRGFDGSVGIEEVTRGGVTYMDLAVPQDTGEQYDWVMSLEVAEHIPASHEAVFLGNLVRHARTGLVLSWAAPGQGGYWHVNEQPNEYAVRRLADLNFKLDHELTQRLRARVESAWWFNNTLMVFKRSAASAAGGDGGGDGDGAGGSTSSSNRHRKAVDHHQHHHHRMG